MEDTLRVSSTFGQPNIFGVLILVLMEDTLREKKIGSKIQKLEGVLILVLMEDTLRVFTIFVTLIRYSLNPCFNGRYSQSKWANNVMNIRKVVLILVLMEDTLRDRV